jgi:hypothetical protein
MSKNDVMLGMSDRTRLSAGITYLMLKGAGYAAIVVFGAWILIALLSWFGGAVLPEDARTAADPAPQAFVDLAASARAADAAAMAPAAAAAETVATEAAPAEDAAAATDATATDATATTDQAAPAEGDAAASE